MWKLIAWTSAELAVKRQDTFFLSFNNTEAFSNKVKPNYYIDKTWNRNKILKYRGTDKKYGKRKLVIGLPGLYKKVTLHFNCIPATSFWSRKRSARSNNARDLHSPDINISPTHPEAPWELAKSTSEQLLFNNSGFYQPNKKGSWQEKRLTVSIGSSVA